MPTLLLIGPLIPLGFLFGPPTFDDPDSYWHLATGKEILTQATLPQTDPWSFASANEPWLNISWLFDLLLALFEKTFGETGLLLLPTILAILPVIALHQSLPLWGVSQAPARLLTTFASGLVLISYSSLRPQLVGALLAVCTLAILQASRKQPKALLWLFPLTTLWANLHGSFLLLMGFLLAHGVEALLKKNPKRAKTLALATLGCGLCSLVNPLGANLYQATLKTTHSVITPHIAEWAPWEVSWNNLAGGTTLLFVVLLFASALFTPNKKPPLVDKILTLSFLILALTSMRFFLFLAVIAGPFIALQLDTTKNPERAYKHFLFFTCFWLYPLLAICLLQQKEIYHRLSLKSLYHQFDRETISALIEHQPNSRVFSSYDTGGALALLGSQPKHLKHFIDGRAGTAFPEETLKEYLSLPHQIESFPKLLQKYQINAAILPNGENPLLEELHKIHWNKVHENLKYTVYTHP